MKIREGKIGCRFEMRLHGRLDGSDGIFAPDCVYVESRGARCDDLLQIMVWFGEWNTRGKVMEWDIKQSFRKDARIIVAWDFTNPMNDVVVEGVAMVGRLYGGRRTVYNVPENMVMRYYDRDFLLPDGLLAGVLYEAITMKTPRNISMAEITVTSVILSCPRHTASMVAAMGCE